MAGPKSEVFVKLVLVFFVSLLSFAIGTYVGRKYSDNQHKMASLEPGGDHASRKVASEKKSQGHSKGHETEKLLSDEEIAKLAEEFVNDDNPVAAAGSHDEGHSKEAQSDQQHDEASHAKPTAKNHEAAVSEEPHAATPKKEPTSEKVPTPLAVAKALAKAHHQDPTSEAPDRNPSSIPKDVAQYSVGKFTVQVASFASRADAEKRAEELAEKGHKSFVVPAVVKGRSWFRVSLGLFASESEAKAYRVEVQKKSNLENAIISKITEN